MDLMSRPLAASARIADSRPAPGPFTFTSTLRTPCSCASCAAFCAATCAANGVPLRDPLKPMRPALDHDRMLPTGSVMATMVLLNVAAMEATPCGTFFRSLRFVPARRAPAFGALAVAICSVPQILRFAQNDVASATSLLGRLLLARDGSLARTLARARIGVRALAADR